MLKRILKKRYIVHIYRTRFLSANHITYYIRVLTFSPSFVEKFVSAMSHKTYPVYVIPSLINFVLLELKIILENVRHIHVMVHRFLRSGGH